MKNLKLIVSLLLTGFIVLFVTQNVAVVEIRFMFWQIAMSRSLLIFFVLAIGILTGWLLHSFMTHHHSDKRDERTLPSSAGYS